MNVLIVKLSALGDVIHALPVAHALKESHPHWRVSWIVEPAARPLLLDNPCLDEVLTFEKARFKSGLRGWLDNFPPLRRELRKRRFDIALDLQGLMKSALIAYFSGARQCLGVEHLREGAGLVSKAVVGKHATGHIVERNLDVARALGCRVDSVEFPIAISEGETASAHQVLQRHGVPSEGKYAVLVVGASRANKRWSARSFASLCNWLGDEGIIPVLAGAGVIDESLAADIANLAIVPPVNLVSRTTLKELAAVIRDSRFVVGADTGPVHLAAALRVPTVMLMGPTDANRNGPYGQMQHVLEVNRPCKHCWKRVCPKGIDCLAAISPERVKDMIQLSVDY